MAANLLLTPMTPQMTATMPASARNATALGLDSTVRTTVPKTLARTAVYAQPRFADLWHSKATISPHAGRP